MRVITIAIICGVLVSTLFWSCGCVKKQPVKPEEDGNRSLMQTKQVLPSKSSQMQYLTHTIQWPGESLIRISRWYTGSGNNWRLIVDANPSVDHRRMKIGDTILIPKDLLKTHEPMPAAYRVPRSSSQKKKAPKSPPASAPAPAPKASVLPPPAPEKVELFGPIDDEMQVIHSEETGESLSLETIE